MRDFTQDVYIDEVNDELTLLLERLAEPRFMDEYALYAGGDTSEFLGDLAAELVNEFGLDIEDWGEGASWRLPGNNVLMAVGREGGDRYVIRPLPARG